MDDYNKFIDAMRRRLIDYVDPDAPNEPAQHPLEFANHVVDVWYAKFSRCSLPDYSDAEEAFWFMIYQLEELEELRMLVPDDPMIGYMEANLAKVLPALKGQAVVTGFAASRPNGDDGEEFEDDAPHVN